MTPRLSLAFLLALVAVACSPGRGAAPAGGPATVTANAPTISAAAREEAAQIFATRCTVCHGPTGAGDGAASATLSPRPRNFHDAEWQHSVNDEHIEKIVMYGGAAVGKSAAMPPNPDLAAKTDVVSALRELVRGFGK